MMHRISMTKQQESQAKWALEGVQDKAEADDRECRSHIHFGALVLMDEEDTADMLYRLEEQLQTMAYDARFEKDGAAIQGHARAALNLAKRIREITGYQGG